MRRDLIPTLVAVSHGTSDPRGQGAVRRLVDEVQQRLPYVDVRQAFVDVESPDLTSVLAGVDGPVSVVPLLLGAGFHVHVDIATAVAERTAAGRQTWTAATLGPDAALTAMLADRLRQAGLGADDAVVLAVAGSSDVRARLSSDRAAAMLATRLRRRVRVGHLGGSGRALDDVVAEARATVGPRGRVVAANYLLAPGFFDTRLAASAADLVTAPLSSGLRVDDRLVHVVVRRYRAHASHTPLARLG
ncbi:MAG TPA: CbiX/SirB N-terminal domain-containing protein [Aeromicrobium sp.]|nr:CbiX/SirB N-terminal domain-containing protein [Aeromicrobium sp.]